MILVNDSFISFDLDSYDKYTHIPQAYSTGTGAIVWLGKIKLRGTTTEYNQAQTVWIILGRTVQRGECFTTKKPLQIISMSNKHVHA